ncbi:MAG: SDR family oxidoreductase [marine benthic group bacterium]|nr:SDR family oxidoreductase [Gemmatimonadota bacterium]MCL7963397.1 SDR family oxidoreductase [Candidatus Carthagonibacter metallireducens]MCL7957627.1 SDR family oxidoreductase [Gemmatimonadota bacterium]MCL7968437.1 SDR family oxidoreductase [Gemmatimonadota bacterium]MCL7973062.1 SDR family oxidoreductase [Gemmatimonadota bacterium]
MNGRVALVTGASSGIGRATAEVFAAKGAKVVLAARRSEELASLADEIEGRGGEATVITTDVSSPRDVEAMVAHAMETFGRLDYAVNNAGTEGKFAAITELTVEEWDAVLGVNLRGAFLCMKSEAAAMLEAGNGGAIVNVGSVNSFLGFPSGSAYVASKHGLIGLTTSVSAELASQGIRVNAVCPGIIDTPMHHRARGLLGDEVYDSVVLPSVHLQRAGRPEEIAQAIVFLCSDEASYITGATLTPDGGFTLTI